MAEQHSKPHAVGSIDSARPITGDNLSMILAEVAAQCGTMHEIAAQLVDEGQGERGAIARAHAIQVMAGGAKNILCNAAAFIDQREGA